MRPLPKMLFLGLAIAMTTTTLLTPAMAGNKGPSPMTWKGNGSYVDGDGKRVPETSECTSGGTYVEWQLTATKGITGSPTLSFGALAPSATMVQQRPNTPFRYVLNLGSFDATNPLGALYSAPVTVTFSGAAKPTLTIAKACLPVTMLMGVAEFAGEPDFDEISGGRCPGGTGTSAAEVHARKFCADLETLRTFVSPEARVAQWRLYIHGTPDADYNTADPITGLVDYCAFNASQSFSLSFTKTTVLPGGTTIPAFWQGDIPVLFAFTAKGSFNLSDDIVLGDPDYFDLVFNGVTYRFVTHSTWNPRRIFDLTPIPSCP